MKLSRPVVYTLVLGVAAYAVMLLTEPDAPPKKVAKPSSSSSSKSKDGITEADLTAHFPPYAGPRRDAFNPLVTPKRTLVARTDVAPKRVDSTAGNWALTGITVIDGARSAVIENSQTHDIAFLTPGERWNGLKVDSVNADSVLLMNALNQPVTITFAAPPTTPTPGAAVPPNGAPGAAAPTQVPVAPVTPPTNRRGRATTASTESVNVR